MHDDVVNISIAGLNQKAEYGQAIHEALVAGLSDTNKISVTSNPEKDNPFDSMAIRLDFNGKPVGYVPRKEQELLLQIAPELFNKASRGKVVELGFVYKPQGNFIYCNIILAVPE